MVVRRSYSRSHKNQVRDFIEKRQEKVICNCLQGRETFNERLSVTK